MKHLSALTRREAGALLHMPSLYAVTSFFVLLYGLVFYLVPMQYNLAMFEPVALFICFLSIFLVPLITMRAFAEETRSGTIEMLLTTPVGAGEVVLSKFLAAFIYYLFTLLPCLAYLGLLAHFGDIDSGTAMANLLGLALVGAMFVSIGILASSLTDSQIVAAAAACGAILLILLLAYFTESTNPVVVFLGNLSFVPRFKESFGRGVLDTRDLVYFLTVPAGMLFLTWIGLRYRGQLGRTGGDVRRGWTLAAGLLLTAAVELLLFGIARMDVEKTALGTLFSQHPLPEEESKFLLLLPLVLGVLFLGLALLAWRRSRTQREGWKATLQTSQVLPALVLAAAVLVILVNINVTASFYWQRWDVSEEGQNTLSLDTRVTLGELTDPARLTVFLSDEIDYQGVPLKDHVKHLLAVYQSTSPKLEVVYADAMAEPERARELGQSLGIPAAQLPYTLAVSYQGRHAVIPASFLLRPPDWKAQMAGVKTPSFAGELPFTLALKRLIDPRITRIYFTNGHGELNTASSVNEPGAAGKFAQSLRQEGFAIGSLLLRPDQPVPADCDVLVVAGPRLPLGEAVVGHLRDYLLGGGRMLLLLASSTELQTEDKELEAFLTSLGGTPRNDIVLDPRNNDNGLASSAYALASSTHPIAQAARSVVCIVSHARSFRERPGVDKNGWVMDRLLVSAGTALGQWKDKEDKWKRRKGPLTLGFTSARPSTASAPEARLVALGNAAMASNLFLEKGHNKTFLTATVHWLAGRDYQLRIEPPEDVDRTFKLTGAQQRLSWWISLIALPQVFVLLGILVWWMRKE